MTAAPSGFSSSMVIPGSHALAMLLGGSGPESLRRRHPTILRAWTSMTNATNTNLLQVAT